MRFYDLKIVDPKSNQAVLHWSSYPNGTYDPGALNVSFDVLTYQQAVPMGGSTIVIEGIPPTLLTNANDYSNMVCELRVGMGPGLPLATPSQIGLIAQGQVYQVFANWIGTEINLALVLMASTYTLANPGNIVLNWTAGTSLQSALQNTLRVAFPNATVQMHIRDIVLNHDEKHAASTLSGLARFVSDITGVQIAMRGNVISVYDSSYQPIAKTLDFLDFIGQPMWIAPNVIQVTTVMRGDIQMGDQIKMPENYPSLPGFVQTTTAAYPSQANYKSAIKGTFVVQSTRHVGNLRQPNGRAWATIINAASPVVS